MLAESQPIQSGPSSEIGKLRRTERPPHRQRPIIPQYCIERPGEEPAPGVVAPATDQVVDDDATCRERVEGLKGSNDVFIAQVMKEERAGDIVERPVSVRHPMHVGAHETEPWLG